MDLRCGDVVSGGLVNLVLASLNLACLGFKRTSTLGKQGTSLHLAVPDGHPVHEYHSNTGVIQRLQK